MNFNELFELDEPVHNDSAASFFVEDDLQAQRMAFLLVKKLLPTVSDNDLNLLLAGLHEQANPHAVYRALNEEYALLDNMLRDPAELVEYHITRALGSA